MNVKYWLRLSSFFFVDRSVLKSFWKKRSLPTLIRLFAIIIVFSAENSIVIEFETGKKKKICNRVISFCLGCFLRKLLNFYLRNALDWKVKREEESSESKISNFFLLQIFVAAHKNISQRKE